MITQEEWVSINTTPDVVERWLTTPELLDQWRSPLVILEPLEGDLMAPGSLHRMRLKSLALAGAEYTVAERDAGHILLTISGLWRGKELWRWFSDGSRTIVQNRVEYEVPNEALRVFVVGVGRLLAELDMRIQLDRLRRMIEGPPAPIAQSSVPNAQRITIERQ
jgi:hypothetical protein